MLRHLSVVFVLTAGCASLHEEPNKTDAVSVDDAADFKTISAKQGTGLADYQTAAGKGQAEWIACSSAKATATVLVMHTERAAYDPARFCHGWHAQSFLAAGYDVLTINRPGFGHSSGTPDYSGPASTAAVRAAIPLALAAAKLPEVIGAWGYGTGASAAALTVKQLPGLKFLLVGGGIYDYEETLRNSTDAKIKSLAQAVKSLGDKALEDRSVGYDPSGLPSVVVVYHGASDSAVPLNQAKAFADALTSSGQVKVTFQALPNQEHNLPWVYHRHIIEALLKGITTPPAHHH